MHVGLVIYRLMGRSGGEQGTVELANALAGRGISVTVLSADKVELPPNAAFEAVDLGVGKLNNQAALEAMGPAVDREASARSIDLLHSMGPMVACDCYQPRGGTVAETHQQYKAMPRGWLEQLRVNWKVRFSHSARSQLARERAFYARRPLPAIIAVSRYVARQLGQHYAIGIEHIHTVFNAIEVQPVAPDQRAAWRRELRTELAVPDGAILLLFSAQHFNQKGLGYLLEAMARAEASGARMMLAVLGRDKPERYRQQAARLGLSAAVHFAGAVPRERVWAWISAADLQVLPTVYDSCSRTVLEGLAAGLPAITTEHNGAGELVDESGAGVVIHAAWAIDELASALVDACDDSIRRQWTEATAGLDRRVSVGRMVDELLPVYDQILSKRRSGGTS